MQDAKLAWELFDRHDKHRFWALLVFMLVNGGLEMCSMGLIFPYIGIIGDPGLMRRNVLLGKIIGFLGLTNFNHLIVFLSLLLLGLFIFKNLFGLFLQNLLLRFALQKQLALCRMQMNTCIIRPYEYFLTHNSADVVRNLTNAIPNVCTGVILPWLNVLTEVFLMTGVLTLIIYVQPVAALIAIGVVGPLAFVLFKACRQRTLGYGNEQNLQYRSMLKHSAETLQGIKEIKASGRGKYFVDRYLKSTYHFLLAGRRYSFMVNVPRAFLEVTMIGAITLVVLVMLYFTHERIQQVVPLLALYAAAAVRVMPSFNRIITAMNGIRFSQASLSEVVSEYREGLRLDAAQIPDKDSAAERTWVLRQAVELRDIVFRYAGAGETLFDGLSLRIRQGECVAFIGRSGSGKSTLVDLILGLLSPESGVVEVDGHGICSDLSAWQRQVGYVPQQIYLVDDTLLRNVALGVADEDIDLERLRNVIAMADLKNYVDELPQGLATLVGEQGVMLSGGQRQRIGIARALYRQPSLLIMDEATSALDNISERKVIEAISALGKSVTVIMVAHRLSTVRYCDQVYLLDKGRVVDFGDYDHIAERHPYFINPGGGNFEAAAAKEARLV